MVLDCRQMQEAFKTILPMHIAFSLWLLELPKFEMRKRHWRRGACPTAEPVHAIPANRHSLSLDPLSTVVDALFPLYLPLPFSLYSSSRHFPSPDSSPTRLLLPSTFLSLYIWNLLCLAIVV